MCGEQQELGMKPKPSEKDLKCFVNYLGREPQWVKAGDMCRVFGFSITENNKRYIRAIAEKSDGLIISGQKGYRHILHATKDEINHASNQLEHQAMLMASRAAAIRRQAHKLTH